MRDGALHQATFSSPERYLRRDSRAMAANSPWPCDLGIDLSRGFRALKTWFTLQVHGADRMGQSIYGTCELARYLAGRILVQPELELLAPATLNIVCFRYRGPVQDVDELNAAIVADVQHSGLAAPSITTVNGQLAIRCAIVNHRTRRNDIEILLKAVLDCCERLLSQRR